jgi:hypothetical protein
MKFLATIFVLTVFCGIASANSQNNGGGDKKFRWNKVQCTYSEALAIAEKAALEKFPEYKKKILDNMEKNFSERHGGDEPETIIRKYILEYKKLEQEKPNGQQYSCQTAKGIMYYHGSYYKDSINVILNNSCEVVDVNHEKDTYYYVY